MQVFKKLFGKQTNAAASSNGTPANAPVNNVAEDELHEKQEEAGLMHAFDAQGREFSMPREEWREKVLPGMLKDSWANPEQLFHIIALSFRDGFTADILDAAQHLREIDTNPERGSTMYAACLIEVGQIDKASEVTDEYVAKYGETAATATNRSRIFTEQNKPEEARKAIWKALELDPNDRNAFGWYISEINAHDGKAAAHEAMLRVAELPNAWRAHLCLADEALEAKNLKGALEIYNKVFTMVKDPVPADLLMQISGDLGKHGHAEEIEKLVLPLFKPEVHGLAVGNNLLHSYVDLNKVKEADALIEKLFTVAAPAWFDRLDGWDAMVTRAKLELFKAKQKKEEPQQAPEQPSVNTIVIEQPVWLDSITLNTMLTPKADDAPIIAVAGSTFEGPVDDKERAELMKNDAPGRISRATPIFIADELRMRTNAKTRVLMPWLMTNGGGYVLFGKSTPEIGAVQLGKLGHGQSHYVITIHINGKEYPWVTEMRILRVADGIVLASKIFDIDPQNMEKYFRAIADAAVELCVEVARVKKVEVPQIYTLPDGHWFDTFLILGEQSLAFALADRFTKGVSSICGEYRMVRDTLGLCYDKPDNVPARLLLYSTLIHVSASKPASIRVHKPLIEKLQAERPLPEPFNARIAQMQAKIFENIH